MYRILHLNLSSVGIGHYGLMLGRALAAHDRIEASSIVNGKVLKSPLTQSVAARFPLRSTLPDSLLGKVKTLFLALGSALRFHPHVIHDSSGSSVPFMLAAWPLLRLIAPLVITEHDPLPHSGMGAMARQRLARGILRRAASGVVVHGNRAKAYLAGRGLEESRIAVIPHGDYSFFDPSSRTVKKKNRHRVLFFGALRPNKGLDLLLPAARIVHREIPSARFVVAGSTRVAKELMRSDWPRRLRAMLDEMDRLDYFEVHDDFVPDEEVASFFLRSGISLLPYRDATQSGVAMIAMPLGSVVVATDVGDIGNVVRHGETGILCRPDAGSIARALIRVMKDPDAWERLSNSARRYCAENHSWSRIAGEHYSFYRSLAGRGDRNLRSGPAI